MSQDETLTDSPPEEDKPEVSSINWPRLLLTAAIFSVLSFAILFLWGGRNELRTVKPGFPAPELSYMDLNQRLVSLSDYKGKVVLLNLWSITCPPCVEEVPYLEKLYQQMKEENDFHMMTVNTNRGETEKEIIPFVKKHGVNFQVLVDNKKDAWRKYKLTGWPETFLIDREGIIVEKFIGPKEWDSPEILEKIKGLINK